MDTLFIPTGEFRSPAAMTQYRQYKQIKTQINDLLYGSVLQHTERSTQNHWTSPRYQLVQLITVLMFSMFTSPHSFFPLCFWTEWVTPFNSSNSISWKPNCAVPLDRKLLLHPRAVQPAAAAACPLKASWDCPGLPPPAPLSLLSLSDDKWLRAALKCSTNRWLVLGLVVPYYSMSNPINFPLESGLSCTTLFIFF